MTLKDTFYGSWTTKNYCVVDKLVDVISDATTLSNVKQALTDTETCVQH